MAEPSKAHPRAVQRRSKGAKTAPEADVRVATLPEVAQPDVAPETKGHEKAAAEKMCAACRTERPREHMLRFVRGADGQPLLDLRKKAPGRGESVCMRKVCLNKVKGVKIAEVSKLIGADIFNTLGLARRQNRLTLGADSVSKLLAMDGGSCAFISKDSAERTHKDVRFAAEQSEEQHGLRVIAIPASQDELAAAVGRDGAVGVLGLDAKTLRHGMCAGLNWGLYIGTIGFFLMLMFLFIRVLPMISVFELRELVNITKVRKEIGEEDHGKAAPAH